MKMNRRHRFCATLLSLMLLMPPLGHSEEGFLAEAEVVAPDAVEWSDASSEIELDSLGEFDGALPAPVLDDVVLDAAEPLNVAVLLSEQTPVQPGPEAGAEAIPEQIDLGVQQKYTLPLEATSPGSFTYKSNKGDVASVSRKGVVTGQARGKARISCYQDKTLLGTCVVRVFNAPETVSFATGSLDIGVKESVQLEPLIDKNARTAFTWFVKDEETVSFTQEGLITGKKTGKTTVTVRTSNGKKAKLIVRVADAPKKLSLNEKNLDMERGTTFQLQVMLPEQTASHSIIWTSSDEGVATVDDQGKVTAISKGETSITASAFNGKRVSCSVTVHLAPDDDDLDVAYRALLIGQVDFSEPRVSNRSDVIRLTKMLRTVYGQRGGNWKVTQGYNLDRSAVLKAIKRTFGKAKDDDVSLFFISTHGVSSPEASATMAGALAMIPEYSSVLLLKDLAKALRKIPGKIIVLIDACGSGAAVYAGNAPGAPKVDPIEAERLFNEQVVEACKREARSIDELFMVRGLAEKLSTRSAREVVNAIAMGLDLPKDQMPSIEKSSPNERNVDVEVDVMSALVRMRARQNNIAFQTLASQGDLADVARGHDAPLLHGWRRKIVGEELLSFLRGELAIVCEGSDVKVTNR